MIATVALAQKPVVDSYQVTVVLTNGHRIRGLLFDVTETYLFVGQDRRNPGGSIPSDNIRKVILRRTSKKNALISGAIVGGLAVGFLSHQSLQNRPTSGPVAHGLTVIFAAAGGATAGLLVGAAVSTITSRVVRPLNEQNPARSLFRQLEPFSWRYQQDLINQLPQTNQ